MYFPLVLMDFEQGWTICHHISSPTGCFCTWQYDEMTFLTQNKGRKKFTVELNDCADVLWGDIWMTGLLFVGSFTKILLWPDWSKCRKHIILLKRKKNTSKNTLCILMHYCINFCSINTAQLVWSHWKFLQEKVNFKHLDDALNKHGILNT